jgi:SAM-dependent methyltransferase
MSDLSTQAALTCAEPSPMVPGRAAAGSPLPPLQTVDHWCRVVMNSATQEIVGQLPFSSFDVLEVSGTSWRAAGFRSYRAVRYPEFDICREALPEQFDLVIAEQVFEHLRSPFSAARNVLQMLRPGGYFLITTPFLIRFHPEPLDLWRWTRDGLRFFLEDAGFAQAATQSWGNKECLVANLDQWVEFEPHHRLQDDPRFPLVVWGLARKAS